MISGINHVTVSVDDMEESFHFYVDIMGFKPIQKNSKSAYLAAGDLWFVLDKSRDPSAAPARDLSDLAFNLDAESFAATKARLIANGAKPWMDNLSEGESFYFLDPNGHKLEIAVSNLDNRIAYGKKHWNLGNDIQWFV
jgi:catechol 2,3-dioxygenase-like lactoylglutathione lyase family enzyme